jgi:uncharacterized membrane protein (UPF0127 family)
MKSVPSFVISALLVFSACAESPSQETAGITDVTPQQSAPVPRAILPDGSPIDLELALTPQEISTGLSFRPSLRQDRGMLFVFDEARYPSFWMKNMLFSLDLVFLNESGAVVYVEANVPPCAADPCPTYPPSDPAIAVLEVNAGTAAAHGIEKGTVIEFERVPDYPVALEE